MLIKNINKFIILLVLVNINYIVTNIACAAISPPAILEQKSLSTMLKKAMPSVVNIKIYNKDKYLELLTEARKDPHFNLNNNLPEYGIIGMGSGVIIDAQKGIIATNNHVIKDANKIIITMHDNKKLEAKLIGSDPDTDLAVLKTELENLPNKELSFASSEKAEVGDFVFAIGSPFNLNQTVTSGIISAKKRIIDLPGINFEDFIQTDAAINPGNSGGALINIRGELIGINTAISTTSGGSVGTNFAIPSDMVKAVINQLLKFGKVRRGMLGVIAQTVTPDLALAFDMPNITGALVDTITIDSVAYNSDLKIGDIITKVNNKLISSAADLKNSMGLIEVNQDIQLSVIRNKKPMAITVKMLDPAAIKTRAQKISSAFMSVYLDPVKNIKIPHQPEINGLKIIELSPESTAWQQGLRPNDIIVSINNNNASNLEELEQAVKYNQNKPLLLRLIRDNNSFFMALKSK